MLRSTSSIAFLFLVSGSALLLLLAQDGVAKSTEATTNKPVDKLSSALEAATKIKLETSAEDGETEADESSSSEDDDSPVAHHHHVHFHPRNSTTTKKPCPTVVNKDKETNEAEIVEDDGDKEPKKGASAVKSRGSHISLSMNGKFKHSNPTAEKPEESRSNLASLLASAKPDVVATSSPKTATTSPTTSKPSSSNSTTKSASVKLTTPSGGSTKPDKSSATQTTLAATIEDDAGDEEDSTDDYSDEGYDSSLLPVE